MKVNGYHTIKIWQHSILDHKSDTMFVTAQLEDKNENNKTAKQELKNLVNLFWNNRTAPIREQ